MSQVRRKAEAGSVGCGKIAKAVLPFPFQALASKLKRKIQAERADKAAQPS